MYDEAMDRTSKLAKFFKKEATVDVRRTPNLVQEISKYLNRIGFYTRDYISSINPSDVMESNKWKIHELSDGKYYSQERLNDICDLQILANEKSALVMRTDTNEASIVSSVEELSQFLEADKVDYQKGAPVQYYPTDSSSYVNALRPFDC